MTRFRMTITACFVFLALPIVAISAAAQPDALPTRQELQLLPAAKLQRFVDGQFFEQQRKITSTPSTQTNYDVLIYDIQMKVVEEIDSIYGAVRITALATQDGVAQVEVDLKDALPIDSIMALSGPLTYTRANFVVTVSLDGIYDSGEQFEFVVYYQARAGFITYQDFRYMATFSEPYDARTWWPCKDRMDDKADSFHIAVTVDTGYYLGSNGTLDSVVQHGDEWQTFYYTEHYPMATYLFSLAVAPYIVWHDEWVHNNDLDTMLITHAVFPDVYDYSLPKYGITPGALTILSDLFGPYPFADEKYGHANSATGGAMEHQTMSTMSKTEWVFEARVVVHELAHQWWGDMITCESWGHLWLNEGWATYAEALYFEQLWGGEHYFDYMDGMAYTGNLTVYVYDTNDFSNFFSSAQYHKGAWVMHMLRGVLGDSLFFEGFHQFYNSEFKWGAATTEDVRDIYEAISGEDLDWFFEQWVYGVGQPTYRWSYYQEVSDTGGYDVYLEVKQVQTTEPQVFRMPVQFRFGQQGAAADTVVVMIDERRELIKLNFPYEVPAYAIKLDPRHWVLKFEDYESWDMRIITTDDELSLAQQYLPFADTIVTKGGLNRQMFTITNGALPSGYTINDTGVVTGITDDTGSFTFTVNVVDLQIVGYEDEKEFTLYVSPTSVVPGDIDHSGEIDVSDLVYLVDYMFTGGAAPPIMHLADVDASCVQDIGDLVYLVDFMFSGGPTPLMGCIAP